MFSARTSVSVISMMLFAASALAADPKVAVIPFVNVSGEKWVELRDEVTARVSSTFEDELSYRRVAIVPKSEITSAVAESKVDWSDEENWNKKNMYDVARKVGAKYVVFVAVTKQEQRTRQNFLVSTPEGEVEVKVWVLDAELEKPVINGKVFRDKARPSSWLGVAKGSDQQKTAADRVARSSLRDFWKLLDLTDEGRKRTRVKL